MHRLFSLVWFLAFAAAAQPRLEVTSLRGTKFYSLPAALENWPSK